MLKFLRTIYFYLAIGLSSLAVLPVFFLRPFNPKNTSFFFSLFSRVSFWATGLSYEEINSEVIKKTRPAIIVSNHQHNFDSIVASKALAKKTVFLGKKELLYIPFLGLAFYFGGNVFVDRSNRKKAMESLNKIKRTLEDNDLSATIFAEGTRNPGAKLLPFKKGAFHVAIQTGLPIIPMAVSRYARNMDLNKKRSGKIIVEFLEPIETKGMSSDDALTLSEMTRGRIEEVLRKNDQKM